MFNMQSCDEIHFSETFQTAYSYTPILELESGCDRSSQPGGGLNEWNSHGFHTLAAGAEELPYQKGSKWTMMAAGGINLVPEVITCGKTTSRSFVSRSFVTRNAEARICHCVSLGAGVWRIPGPMLPY